MDKFAGVSDVAQFLQVTIEATGQLTAVERALVAATAAIRNYTEQHLSLVEDDEILLDSHGWRRLHLPELPVVAVASVTENGTALTAGDDFKLDGAGILHRIGRRWATGIANVAVTYTHGYAEIPADIFEICVRAASRAYQAGLSAAEHEGLAGVQSKALGDFSVGFGSEQGGGIGEGLMGASGARLLLLSEKDILDRYRV
jgi:hypothetical protein